MLGELRQSRLHYFEGHVHSSSLAAMARVKTELAGAGVLHEIKEWGGIFSICSRKWRASRENRKGGER
jgi:hypothetical protein